MPAIILERLRKLEIITDDELRKLAKYYVMKIRNHKQEIVGETKLEFKLIKNTPVMQKS